MRLANARLVAQLARRTEDYSYGDTAYIVINVPIGAYDEYNNAVTAESLVPIACSFTDKASNENWRDYADIESVDCEIRFAAQTAPNKGQRVTLAGRFDGDTYANKTFEIIGIKNRDAFGFVCALKAVTI